MATYVWTGAAGDGNWSTPGNWNPSTGFPTAGDTVTIDLTVAGAINASNQAALDLTINKFVTLDVNDNTNFTFGSGGSAAATFANSGTLALNSGNNATPLIVASPTLSLTGTGTLLLSNNAANLIEAAAAGNELDNVSNLIEGAGQIGGTDLSFVNGAAGTLNANQAAGLYLNTGSSLTLNSGLLEATGAGALFIQSTVNNGTLGQISASGADVYLQGGDIQGGTITSSSGADLVVNASGTLDGSAHAVTNGGTVVVDDNQALNLLGSIVNDGMIALASTNDATDLTIGPATGTIAGTVTLTGGGQVVLSDNLANIITDGIAGDTLVNLNNTISGAGQVTGSLVLVNDATIDANTTNALVINTSATVTNSGTLEATGAGNGNLVINSVINSGTAGIILASGDNVNLESGTLQGGTIKSSGGGELVETATGTLDGTAHAVTNLGTVVVDDNQALNLLGSIVNDGMIALASTNDATDLTIGPTTGTIAGTVTLTGGGQVVLSDNLANIITDGIAGDTLVNLNNTISGAGQVTGSLVLVNDATIDANTTNALVIENSATVTNSGTLEATGAGNGNLVINSVINSGTAGIILASGDNVNLESGTLQGGTIKSSGGGELVETATGTLDGTAHAVTNLGTVVVDDNQVLKLLGSIVNDGTIVLASTNDATYLEIASPTVSLTGTGTIALGNNGGNDIFGSPSTDELDNVSNTIEGAGQIGGAAAITLVNGAKGVIDADLSAGLTLNVGPVAVANSGLIEATGPGPLTIERTTVNDKTGGTILASTANVDLDGAIIEGGLIKSSGGGEIVAVAGSNLLDGTSQAVTNKGTLAIVDNQYLGLAGTIINEAPIELNSTNDATGLQVASASVTLTGGGTVVLSDNGGNIIDGAIAADVLDNVNNTIEGGGQFGDNQLTVINGPAGTISATGTYGQLVIHTGSSSFTNSGLIEATGPAGLLITGSTISNGTLGVISGASGIVYLNSTTIQGGTLTDSGAGSIVDQAATTLDGTVNTVVNDATVSVNDNNTLYLLGTISNAGTIALGSTNDMTALIIGPAAGGAVTLTGGGNVVLSNNGANYIYGNDGAGSTLVNLNNTISGGGVLGYNGLLITNDAVIDASTAAALVIDGASLLTNNKLLESTGSGGLLIYDTTISNGTAGTILASGGAVTIQAATIEGGTFTGTGGFYTYQSSTLDGTANPIVNEAAITLYDNYNLFLLGTIDNLGTITVDSGNDMTALIIGPAAGGTVTLTGGGNVVLSNNGANYIYGNDGAGSTLINLNNTISGGGVLGYNGLRVTNDAVIDASTAAALVIDGGSTVTNDGLIESTNTGSLLIASATISNGAAGTVSAAAGNITVQGATIEGGLITGTAGYAVYANSNAVFGGATGTLTNSGNIVVQDNSTVYLAGRIDNNGLITVDSQNDGTELVLDTPTVTLLGTGTIVLSNDGANYVYGSSSSDVLDNVSNTIEGGGNFGDGGMALVNGGIVEADDPTTLTVNLSSTGTNLASGQFLAEDGATLAIDNGTFTNSGLIQADDGSLVDFTGSATLTNNANTGTLTGGSYGAVSTGHGATLSVTGSAVSTIDATIILSGPGATIEFGGDAIDSTLGSIASGGTLSLQDAYDFAVAANGGTLGDSGLISLSAGTLTATSLAIGTGGRLSGAGTVATAVSDAGTITASGGTLVFTGAVSGTGKLSASSGAVLDLTSGGALTEAISGAGTLQLDDAIYSVSGGAISIGTVKVDAGAGLSGHTTLTGALIDSGVVTASGGTLLENGAVSGSGTLSAASGETLQLSGGGSFAGAITGAGRVILAKAITLDAGASLSTASLVAEANVTLASVSVTNAAANRFALYATSGTTVTLSATGTGAFTNLGTLVAEEPGTAVVSAPFTNDGLAEVTAGTLVIAGALSGTGKLSAASGTVLDLTAGGALTEATSGAGTLQLDGGTYSVSGGAISIGTVKVDSSAGLSGHTTLTGALIDSGVVTASGGTLLENGAVSGSGTLSAVSGETLQLSGGGSFAGAITGAGRVIVAKAITLDAGASLSTASLVAEANVTLASVSVTNAAADRFALYATSGTTVTLSATGTGALTNLGTLVAEEPGTAVVSAAFTNSGTVSAQSGTLSFLAGVNGTGTMDVSAGATLSLELGAGSGQVIDFLASSGALDLFNPLDFVGTIKGFGGSDQVFLENTTYTTFGFVNNLLTVKDGTSTVASLKINESSNHFSLVNENHGVLITFT